MIIEMLGTGGTALGKFTRRRDAAWTEWENSEHRILIVYSADTHEPIAEIDTHYGQISDYFTGERLGHAYTWDEAMAISLGKPAYGYTWYAVKGHKRGYRPAFWGQ